MKNSTYFFIKVFLLSSIALLLCISCTNDDSLPPSMPIKEYNIEDLELSVTEAHQLLMTKAGNNLFFIASWGGDDITTDFAGGKAAFRVFDGRSIDLENVGADYVWRSCYEVILSTNKSIDLSEKVITTDLEKKKNLTGEAYFIRGLMYHHLIRMFDKLPLQLENEEDNNIAASDRLAIYKQIESDWSTAEGMLPDVYPNTSKGATRPNKGSALAFLSRLYMDWAGFPIKDNTKYELAASAANKVITNKSRFGFDLVVDLEDLWTIEHRLNNESIFTINYCKSCGLSNKKMGKLGLPIGTGWNETMAEIKFFEDFPEGHRKNATYITDLMIEDPYTNPEDRSTINWTSFSYQKNPVFAKITGKGDIPRSDFGSDRNDYIMRYAEVLLTYAEASARSGNITPASWEALNKIKRRANLLPVDVPNASIDMQTGDLAELAYTERKWELAGEFLRWFDLIRMERVHEVLRDEVRNNILSVELLTGKPIEEQVRILGSTGTDNYFSKIPQAAIQLNPRLNE